MKRPKSASAIINDELQADKNREFPSRDFQAGLRFALWAIRTAKRREAQFQKEQQRAST